jgi:putative addiction module component (TIGR02574 family)
MTMAMRQQMLKLPAEEKIRLIGELWDSLDEARIPELTAAQKAELERRVRRHRLHPEEAVPWEDVMSELRRRRQ